MKLQPVISKENLFWLFGRVRERFRTSMEQPLCSSAPLLTASREEL
ncbi:hypothetical protein HMPREF0766_11944 [Sphingobacterium spiritivorum ATCC 33861]|uniref:Uncharacterized protein n=1 Tax=Sphingobacterium spiritivorum ATCC 33861 TaxID=525373 RepID=D7VLS4_SPHSI|nr:hypothetical protein HMPREF0766_11944 [Sphingobacterium spiritivorum ATCC 33861]